MGSVPVLIWDHRDGMLKELLPFFQKAEQTGMIDIVGLLSETEDGEFVCQPVRAEDASVQYRYVIAPVHLFYSTSIEVLVKAGIQRTRILDGKLFSIPGFDLSEFLRTGIVHGQFSWGKNQIFADESRVSNLRIYEGPAVSLRLGRKSYISGAVFEGNGVVDIGDFTSIAWDVLFEMGLNGMHDYHRTFTYALDLSDFHSPHVDAILAQPTFDSRIEIGSDVWISRGVRMKAADTAHPLRIGDGAVIASDSVVVKDVPPYAIVGGNPAKFIKWRFPETIREALLRIRWWKWPMEKIREHYELMMNPEKFVATFDGYPQ